MADALLRGFSVQTIGNLNASMVSSSLCPTIFIEDKFQISWVVILVIGQCQWLWTVASRYGKIEGLRASEEANRASERAGKMSEGIGSLRGS